MNSEDEISVKWSEDLMNMFDSQHKEKDLDLFFKISENIREMTQVVFNNDVIMDYLLVNRGGKNVRYVSDRLPDVIGSLTNGLIDQMENPRLKSICQRSVNEFIVMAVKQLKGK